MSFDKYFSFQGVLAGDFFLIEKRIKFFVTSTSVRM